jgi:hypothetical protein
LWVEKVFEKRFGLKEKTLLPLHPAAEIKRVSSWKSGVGKRSREGVIFGGGTGLKRGEKKLSKKVWMECEKAFTFATRTARKRGEIRDWF